MGAVCVGGAITGIWTASVVIALPSLLFAETFTYTGTGNTVCYLEWPDGTHGTSDLVYNIFLIVVNYFAPLTALGVTYAVVGCQLWGSQTIGERTPGQEETIRSKRRVVKMLIAVVAIFGVCWLPMHLYFIVGNFFPIGSLDGAQHLYLVIYWIAMSNSMYNPIMYCWMNARFRNGFKYAFRCLPCVDWQWSDALEIGGAKLVRLSQSDGASTLYRPGPSDRNGISARQMTVVSCLSESPEHEPYLKSYVTPKSSSSSTATARLTTPQSNNFHPLPVISSEDAF